MNKLNIKKWTCDFCTPGCTAYGERFPECCPYEYDSDEFFWKECKFEHNNIEERSINSRKKSRITASINCDFIV